MNEPTTVPEAIATMIAQKKAAVEAEHAEKERRAEEQLQAKIAAGRKLLRARIAELLSEVPEWLRQYDTTESTWSDDDLMRVGEGYRTLNEIHLVFHIPGLAPIQGRQDSVRGTTDKIVHEWRSARCHSVWQDYGPELYRLDFTRDSYWETDLDLVLVQAEREQVEFDQVEAKREKYEAEAELAEANKAKRQAEVDARHAAEQAAQEAEEHELFEIFKSDLVAINLLKAFLMIRQERNAFESQLEDANETMYAIEERWSRRAEDLRRQADAAERKAQEERDRADRTQYDLDDAESKLKKASRGW